MFNKSIKSFGICFAVFFVLFFSIRLFAEEIGFTELGVFKKWAAYKINDTESCLIQADPSKATGKYKKRGDTFIQIALEKSSTTSGVIETSEYAAGAFQLRVFLGHEQAKYSSSLAAGSYTVTSGNIT